MQLLYAAAAALAAVIITVSSFGYWAYSVGQEKERLNEEYLKVAGQVRAKEAVAKEAKDRLNDAEVALLEVEDALDEIRPDGQAGAKAAQAQVVPALRARANHLVAAMGWIGYILDPSVAESLTSSASLSEFIPKSVSVSEVRRVADTWIIQGEARRSSDLNRFISRLKISPHLKNITTVQVVEKVDSDSGQIYTFYKLSADIQLRPELQSKPQGQGS